MCLLVPVDASKTHLSRAAASASHAHVEKSRSTFSTQRASSLVVVVFFLPAVTDAGKAGDALAEDFFREEYILNNAIGIKITKPFLLPPSSLLPSWASFCPLLFQEPTKNPT